MSVFRIYVEKRKEFSVEAENLTKEVRTFLSIKNLDSIRILDRYDVEGIDEELFNYCKNTIFSEPGLDNTFDEIPDNADYKFGVEYLAGQYDQKADLYSQSIQLASLGNKPIVKTAKIYLLYGSLKEDDINTIKNYIINPIESQEATLDTFETLKKGYQEPQPVKSIEGFCDMGIDQLSQFLSDFGLAMDLDDLKFCQEYFIKEGRNPTVTEIRMIDTYWSDHCRHTTFSTIIDKDRSKIEDEEVASSFNRYLNIRKELGIQNRPITFMDMATIGAKYLVNIGKLKNLDLSEEVNACSVNITVDIDNKEYPWLLMFKNETHNHPTEIEPFGGAATCLGGAIRDPLSGRAYCYQAMRITGAGNPLSGIEETLPGKLPQRKIVTTAADGYSSYGNQIGVPAGLVDEIYHPGYIAKRMELGAVVAAAPKSNVIREKPTPGDLIILLGGRTGRDGIGAATGSSKSHSVESLEESSAEVQKGNPIEERKIQRLFRNEKVTRLIKRCNDFGAGGVSVAIGELADGVSIQLDKVPKKYEGLDGTELAISESQERMAVVLAPENVQTFIDYAKQENLEATIVAEVTDDNRVTMEWRGDTIVNISREFLNSNGAPKHSHVFVTKQDNETLKESKTSLKESFEALVSDLNVASQKGLKERFDSTAGAANVLMPLGGIYQATPIQAMVSKLPLLKGETNTCSAMSYGFNPYISSENPYRGAYLAVVESISKLVATGAGMENCYLSFQEYFEKLGKDPKRWGKPFSALLGALDAQIDLGVGSIGGKDSMSGSFEDLDVPPTLVSFAISACKVDNIISPEFKRKGSKVVLLSPAYNESGLPDKDSLLECFNTVDRLINDKKILSAYTPTYGGIAEAIFKMGLGNRIGLTLSSSFDTEKLFEYKYGSFVLELSEDIINIGEYLGTTNDSFTIESGDEKIDMFHLMKLYEEKLEPIYTTKTDAVNNIDKFSYHNTKHIKPYRNYGKPTVLIPVFPGINSEYEIQRSFEKAGAITNTLVIKNHSIQDLVDSIDTLAEYIHQSQIIVISGGYTRFITEFFRNTKVTDSLNEFLSKGDGLILGIASGFQALIKLGLLPYGKITDINESGLALTLNQIGRHQSKLVRTRITSNLSPWLMDANVDDIHTVAISSSEGRLVASEEQVRELAEKGQIATQYVDLDGNPTMDLQFNPSGSFYAIEGITSPDGRIFGRMGHSERYENGVFKNVPGNKEQQIFTNALKYFM
jgi:phosphoribosylformylglycinamidine synthase